MRRELQTWISDRLVGHFHDDNGIWRFSYADGWATFDLYPNLPIQNQTIVDGSSHRLVQ